MPKLIGLDTETVIKNHVHRFFSFQLFSTDIKIHKHGNSFYSENSREFENFLTTRTNKAWFVTFNLNFDGIIISRIIQELNLYGNCENKYTVKAVFAGSRLIRITVRHGKLKWVFCDLKNILPIGSLEKIGEVLNYPKFEKPSYLGKRAPKTGKERTDFILYAVRDAEICFKAAKMVQNEFKTFRTTCAGLAIRIYKRDFVNKERVLGVRKFKFPNYPDPMIEKLRLSYHGGRTECFIRGVNFEDINKYDINSLYPYIMKTKPFPNVTRRFNPKHNVNLDFEGIAHVILTCDANFPPICTKKITEDKIEKLVFPNGRINGWFTYPELREVESHNYGKIEKVFEAFEFKETFNPFENYVEKFYKLKTKATKTSDPRREFYKVMLNALYGKFGEHGETRFIEFDGDEIAEENLAKPKRSWYHSVVLASYITAYARLENWQILRRIKPSKMYYTDTDSFNTSENLSRCVGSKLGQLKLEGIAKSGQACFIRAKFYMFNDEITMKGFKIEDSVGALRTAIFKEDFARQEHRILKVFEARRVGKVPLTDCWITKRFSVEPDGKRAYLRDLSAQTLLFENTQSIPVVVRC